MRTIVFVDGYNLYYGLLRKSPFKWLDLFTLFNQHVLDCASDVIEVRYYTAPVLGRMCDHRESPARQRRYLQALRSLHPTRIKIIEGRIIASHPVRRLAKPLPGHENMQSAQVIDFTEKKTDVNIAADLIAGAWTGAYEQAVLCSNDTDLEAALATVRHHHPALRLGLVAPTPKHDHRHIAADLKRHVHWSKRLSATHLERAQLPEQIPGTNLQCPQAWLKSQKPQSQQ